MKHTRKKIACLLLAMLMMAGVLPLFAVTASAAVPTEGKTFDSTYNLEMENVISPTGSLTVEAEIWLPYGFADRGGIIVGNYTETTTDAFDVEIYDNGKVRFYSKVVGEAVFDYDIRQDMGTTDAPKFVKIAVVANTENSFVYLYVNGEKKQHIGKSHLTPGSLATTSTLCVGSDRRGNNAQYFKGKIKNVAIYDDVRTAAEISASAAATSFSVSASDANLVAAYDFTSATPCADLSAKSNDLSFASKYGKKFTSSEMLSLGKSYQKTPHTFEATIYAPTSSARPGIILGNYQKDKTCLSFEIGTDGAPRLFVVNEVGVEQEYSFNYDVRGEEWVHVAIVHDTTELRCYINGSLVESKKMTIEYDIENVETSNPLTLGRDTRTSTVFAGKIRNVAVYSEPLNAFQIRSNYNKGVNIDNEALLAYYNFDEPLANPNIVPDSSKNDYHCSSLWYENDTPKTDYAYSFAIIGDTQKLVYQDANAGTQYTSYIYDWLVKNKESKKIQMVFGVGDITDKNTDAEWALAKEQLHKLDNANLLYSLVMGNHDTVAKLDEYLANESYYTSRIGGYYKDSSLGNYFIKFTVGETKYMVVCLEYGAGDDILLWAGDVIDANPDHRVIVTTHAYMFRDGTTLDVNDVVPPNKSGANDGVKNNGDQMWDKLISQHENIVMAFSGHDPCANVVMRQDKGVHGNTVSQFLVDFQGMDKTYNYQTGMVAMLYFSEDGRNVSVEYISAYRTLEAQKTNANAGDVLYKATNQFDFTALEPKELSIKTTETVTTPEGKNVLRIHYTDGTYQDILLPSATEGADGKDGKDGKDGVNGADGLNGRNGLDGKNASAVLPTVLAAASLTLNVILFVLYLSVKKRKDTEAGEEE